MEKTQSFRLIGMTDTVEIAVNHIGGHNIVFWKDIEQDFPGVKHVQNGKVAISILRDPNGIRIVPHCIKHCPNAVLDVVLSTTVEHVHVDSPVATPRLAVIDGRNDSQNNGHDDGRNDDRKDTSTDAPNDVPTNISTDIPTNLPTNAPTNLPTMSKVMEALHLTPPPADAFISDIGVSTASNTPLLSPLSSPYGVEAALSGSTLASTIALGSSVSFYEPVDQLSLKNNVSTDLDPPNPMNMTLSRRTTTHFDSQLETLHAAVELANRSGLPVNADAMQDLIGKHLVPPTHGDDIQDYLVQNVGRLVKDVGELKLQGDVIEKLARKMIDMQQKALDRLMLIQSKTEAILTQQLELAEYPIPRLFIVLPEEPA
ncbi:hypothetical protein BGX26_004921, partial [Mortierella sp. AD094]